MVDTVSKPADSLLLLSLPPDPDRFQKQLEALKEITWDISSTHEVEALIPRIMKKVTQLMRADRSSFFVVDRERGDLWSKVLQGEHSELIRLRSGEGIAGWVAQTAQSVNLEDAHADPRFDRGWDDHSGYRTRSLLCVPVQNRDMQVIAVLQCLNKQGRRRFNDEDEELLRCIGGQCAVALEGAYLYEALLQRNRALQRAEERVRRANIELELLYDMEQRISEAPSIAALAHETLERACAMLNLEHGALLLLEENAAELFAHTPGQRGPAQTTRTPVELRRARAWLARSRLPVHREREPGGGLEDVLLPDVPETALRETFTAPLSDARTTIGLLQLANRGEASHSEEWLLRMLQLLAGQAARGIVTKRERATRERAERLVLLGHSLGAILHDLRTPMTAVTGYADLMANEPDREKRLEHVARIDRALSHMETMTQEVLAFARGQREIFVQKVYLNNFVADVRELLIPETNRWHVSLMIEQEYDGLARFDENKLKRVIFNLARNACQAMDGSGSFTWRIAREGERLVFECKDTGPGIPREMEGKLFESFASHGKADGTGLGLAMAKKIVDAHGGSIGCSSQPGVGATFRLELPL